jgi:hypothetical protein
MGRGFIVWAMVCVALAFAMQSAEGKDRRGAAGAEREARTALLQHEVVAPWGVTRVAGGPVTVVAAADTSDAATPVGAPRKPVTLFRFTTKAGDVAVQPVFGSAKGAQFSLGF